MDGWMVPITTCMHTHTEMCVRVVWLWVFLLYVWVWGGQVDGWM